MNAEDRNKSDIFLLRVWSDGAEEHHGIIDTDRGKLHGRLLHLTTGSARNFDNWPALLNVLQAMLAPPTLATDEKSDRQNEAKS